MPHQGNIYLGYNLVLLVQSLPAEGKRSVRLDPGLAKRAISAHAQRHLRARFCKEKTNSLKRQIKQIERIVEKRLQFCQLRGRGIPDLSIPRRSPGVFVLIDTHAAGSRWTVPFDAYRDEVRRQDACAHVEQFRIDLPSEQSVAALEKELREIALVTPPSLPKEGGIYHLGSRICAAFVEYRDPPLAHTKPKRRGRKAMAGRRGGRDAQSSLRFRPVSLSNLENTLRRRITADFVPKIMDVRDAVDLVCGCLDGAMRYFPPVPEQLQNIFRGRDTKPVVWTRYKFPFGVWFRGSSRICFDLTPSLFRYASPNLVHKGCKKRADEQVVMFDECSLVQTFREYLPDPKMKSGAMFDWLCLMQHHGAPTRLLDWTENILYGLYFAVRERDVDCDGVVWVLNAGRLNEITRVSSTHRYVCFAHSADVHLRTAMAVSHTWPELRRNLLKLGLLDQVLDSLKGVTRRKMIRLMSGRASAESSTLASVNEHRRLSLCEKLLYPVAVLPGRGSERLAAQSGTFTLHGGKVYDPQLEGNFKPNRFGEPESLVRLNSLVVQKAVHGKPFLDAWVVPSGSKRKIREQLKRLGVHAAAVFPELEYQSEYLRREWMIPVGKESRSE